MWDTGMQRQAMQKFFGGSMDVNLDNLEQDISDLIKEIKSRADEPQESDDETGLGDIWNNW